MTSELILPYNPGSLPTKPRIKKGEYLKFTVVGLPPFKDEGKSIRNINHKFNSRFRDLRKAAISAMDGHAWTFGDVHLKVVINTPMLDKGKSVNDYLAGILDTLDGSSGFSFTYLPIVFEDDNQVHHGECRWERSPDISYLIHIEFLT